jgi:uncharacterized protein YbbK (DUF523 family)
MYLVSACLVGINCKYNGGNNYNEKVLELVKNGQAIPICPEQLGGLTTPRNPSEIVGDRVLMNDGTDVTINYQKGANEVLELCKKLSITKVILKSNSPSCGCGTIYDGTFTGTKVNGNGITTELLLKNGIEVITEKDLA